MGVGLYSQEVLWFASQPAEGFTKGRTSLRPVASCQRPQVIGAVLGSCLLGSYIRLLFVVVGCCWGGCWLLLLAGAGGVGVEAVVGMLLGW